MIGHFGTVPTADNDWASWYCDDCDQPCTSHNPCDCCWDEEQLEYDRPFDAA